MTLSPTFVATYTPVFRRIAHKSVRNQALREDCVQQAFLALLTEVSDDAFAASTNPDAFVRMVARNTMLSYLKSYRTGDWYTGRTWGKEVKQFYRARFVHIDALVDRGDVQIDSTGHLRPGETADRDAYFYTRTLADGTVAVVLPV
jgi:DNA-directed RNA polymerase specialized sigma24 family protein